MLWEKIKQGKGDRPCRLQGWKGACLSEEEAGITWLRSIIVGDEVRKLRGCVGWIM